MDFTTFIPIILAALSGGVVVKIIDVFWQSPARRRDFSDGEKDRLIAEVKRLAEEVKELRGEVSDLRRLLSKKVAVNSGITGAYYGLRTGFITFVNCIKSREFYHGDNADPEFVRAVSNAECIIHEMDNEMAQSAREDVEAGD